MLPSGALHLHACSQVLEQTNEHFGTVSMERCSYERASYSCIIAHSKLIVTALQCAQAIQILEDDNSKQSRDTGALHLAALLVNTALVYMQEGDMLAAEGELRHAASQVAR